MSPLREEELAQGAGEAKTEKSGPKEVSILEGIFPQHAAESNKEPAKADAQAPFLKHLLASVPSPARAGLGQHSRAPAGPPMHAPIPMVAPVVPPPPTAMPAHMCQTFASGTSHSLYRERLRAGGRGAFQRAFNAGFVPKNMSQEWISDMQNTTAMPAWSAQGHMQGAGYCGMPMPGAYQCMSQVPQQPMSVQMMPPQSPIQQPPLQLSQEAMQQMQMQLPAMAFSQVHGSSPSASGYSTPTSEVDSVRSECMAILGQMPCDAEALAAQLRASADCQRYED